MSIRRPVFRILPLLFTFAFAAGCANDKPEPVSATGTMVFNDLEGGFYGIVGDDGRHWDPQDLPDEFAVDGLPVSFRGVPGDVPTFTWPRLDLLEIKRIGDPPPLDLEPFRELARNASCADVRNRLFLIDGYLVFWDQESRCADAAYTYTLYGRTVSRRVCISNDSIAGPQEHCETAGRLSELFHIIVQNLDKPDLGLGTQHTVEPVEF